MHDQGSGQQPRRIPLALKGAYTIFVAVLVPFYWLTYGPQNFLWFCDAALLLTLSALWLASPLLASVPAVGILLPQLLWLIDFLVLLTGHTFLGFADYMFDSDIPLFVRGLSSFHGWLPILLFWMVWKLGYDRRALIVQTLLAWGLLLASFFLTDLPPAPKDDPAKAVNVNWVFGMGKEVQTWTRPELYLALQLAMYPLCVYVPTHLLLRRMVNMHPDHA
jgi:hypothetical protein